MAKITILPCLDSDEIAKQRKQELGVSRDRARELGESAVEISKQGWYLNSQNERVEIPVREAVSHKVSIPPDYILPHNEQHYDEMTIQVSNETTLQASRRLFDDGEKVLALNFANGVSAGGGFLHGARAQEECLCRSSALYLTIKGDPMYGHHAERALPDSTDWAILSPDVPVFRLDDGSMLDKPYLMNFITCAAPYAPTVGKKESSALMRSRIHRVLEIAHAYGYSGLVLGAWGCGAFDNDPVETAKDFRNALFGDFAGAFKRVVFAITDWSPERRMLGPFRDVFPETIGQGPNNSEEKSS